MASIERTAYPRFKRTPTAQNLHALYTPTPDEIAFAQKAARPFQHQLSLLVLLKSFQRLGYFPNLIKFRVSTRFIAFSVKILVWARAVRNSGLFFLLPNTSCLQISIEILFRQMVNRHLVKLPAFLVPAYAPMLTVRIVIPPPLLTTADTRDEIFG